MAFKAESAHVGASPISTTSDETTRIGWSSLDTMTLLVAVLCALSLYFWRLDQPQRYIYDEVYHAYTAARLAEGNRDPYNPFAKVPEQDREQYKVAYEWTHPGFAKLPMQFGIVLFGDTPFGWRFASAIFGAAGIGLMYSLGRMMFNRELGLIAAGLLLLDGLWFVQSRTAMNDVFLVSFLMLSYLSFYQYLTAPFNKRWRHLWATGVALGFALATKWSALYSFGLIGLVATIWEGRVWLSGTDGQAPKRPSRLLQSIGTLAGALLVVPLALYIGGYIQYFLMDYSWSDWRELQRQMWWYHSNLKATHAWASRWWTWPLLIRPVWYHVAYGETTIANVFALGNPLIWWLFLPAIGFVAVKWWQSDFRTIALGLVLLGFLGQWLPWFFSPRISFLYHMLPSVPFGCLAIAYSVQQLRTPRQAMWTYIGLVLIAFIYFYPQYAGWPVTLQYADQHYWLSTWRPPR